MRATPPFLLCTAALVAAVWLGPAARAEDSPGYPVGPDLARHWTSAENRAAVLATLNRLREGLGLQPLRPQADLREAAQGHADYLARHGEASHSQQRGRDGFIGERPIDRALAAGYRARQGNQVVELFVVGLTDGEAALDQLLSGPYHRHFLLWAAASEAGLGLSAQPGLVISLGAPPAAAGPAPAPDWVLWPPPGSQVAGKACCERPRPAGLEEFGMPVSVQAPPGERLRVRRFELLDAQEQPVATQLLHAATDAHLRLAPHVAYLLPLQALQPGQTYQVRVLAEAGGRTLERSWRFQTR